MQENRSDKPSTPSSGRAINPLSSLARHPRLVLICFLAIVLAVIPVAFLKGKPKYFSVGAVQVSPRYMKNMTDDEELLFQSNTQFRQFVQQQVKTISRYDILERALSEKAIEGKRETLLDKWKLPAESPRQALERMQRDLRILPVPDTYLISVAMEQGKSPFLERYINAVMQEYVLTARKEQVYGADERAEQLKTLENELQTKLSKALADKSKVSMELGLSSVNTADGNPYNKVIEQVRLQLADAKLKAFDAQAKYDAFNAVGETDIVIRSIEDAVLNDPGLNSFKASVNNRIANLLTQISGLKDTHPAYVSAYREINELQAEVVVMTAKIRGEVKGALAKRYLVSRDQAVQLKDKLETELARLQEESSAYSVRFNDALNLTEDIVFLRSELQKVRNRLSFFQAEDNSFGLVRVVNQALPPDMPIGAGKKKILMLGIVAALFLAFILPTVIDLLDPHIYAPADMEKALTFPSMGWLIDRIDPDTNLFGSDQLRRLATSLIRTTEQTSQQVFGISGVKISAGSTRMTKDLAEALQVIGKRTIVVDANAYRPARARAYAGREVAPFTLCEMLQGGQYSLDDLPENGGVILAGTKPMERNLPEIEGLKHLLAKLAGKYDFVLVDSPPLLLSADSELVARATGNLVVVVEAERTIKKELVQTRRILERINPESVGAVLNRVSPQNGLGGLNAQLHEFVTGQRQKGPSLGEQLMTAYKAIAWEITAAYAWVRWTVLPMFALPEKYYQEEQAHAVAANDADKSEKSDGPDSSDKTRQA